jgi:hypothetical protein
MSVTSTARRTSFSFRPTRSLLLTTPYASIFPDDPSQLVDVQMHVEKTLSKEPLRTLTPLTNEHSQVSTINPEVVLLECLAAQNERSLLTERARPKGRRQLEAAIINLANQSTQDEAAAIQYQHFKQLYDSDPHSTLEDAETQHGEYTRKSIAISSKPEEPLESTPQPTTPTSGKQTPSSQPTSPKSPTSVIESPSPEPDTTLEMEALMDYENYNS